MTVAFIDDCGAVCGADVWGGKGLIGFICGRVDDCETDVWVEDDIELTDGDRPTTLSDKDSLASLYPREFLGFFFLGLFWTLSKEFFDAFLWRGCDLCC